MHAEPLVPHFGRYGQTWKGFALGLVVFLASFPLLSWNETGTMYNSQKADDRLDRAVSVVTDEVQEVNENRLVHLTGQAVPVATYVDPDLLIVFSMLKLQRQVECWQWIEVPGEPAPTYARAWLSETVKSSEFVEEKGHVNPQRKRLTSWEPTPAPARLGAFELPTDLLDRFNLFTTLKLTDDDLMLLPEKLRRDAHLVDGLLYFGEDAEHPQAGDVRVRYIGVKPSEVSVIGRQSGKTLAPFVTQSGHLLYKIEPGKKSADEMNDAPRVWLTLSTLLTWLFRMIGAAMLASGALIMLERGTPGLERVGWLKPLLSLGPFVFAGVLSATLTLLTIGFSWLSYSWLLGGFLMTLGGLVPFLAIRASQRLGSPTVSQSASPTHV